MHKVSACFFLMSSFISNQESKIPVSSFQPQPLQEQAFNVCVKKFVHDKKYSAEELESFAAFVTQAPSSFFKGMQMVKVSDLTKELFDSYFLDDNPCIVGDKKIINPDGCFSAYSAVDNAFSLNIIDTKKINRANFNDVAKNNFYVLHDKRNNQGLSPIVDYYVNLGFLVNHNPGSSIGFLDTKISAWPEHSLLIVRLSRAIAISLINKKVYYIESIDKSDEFSKEWQMIFLDANNSLVATQKRIFKYVIETKSIDNLFTFEKLGSEIRLSSYGVAYICDDKIMARSFANFEDELVVTTCLIWRTKFFLPDEPYILCLKGNYGSLELFNLKTKEFLLPLTKDFLFEFRDDGMYMTMSTEKAVKDFLHTAQAGQMQAQPINSNCNN